MAPASSTSSAKTPLEEADAIIDMHKPLVFQILNLNREQYLAWTHTTYHFSGEQKDARLFGPDWMEMFTKTAWYAIPAFWIPVIAYLAWPFARDSGIVLTLALIGVGIFLWTLAEYSIHRFLFHLDDALPNIRPLLLVHFLLHGIHHKVPMDRYRLVMPPALGVVLAWGLYAFFRAVFFAFPLDAYHAAFAGGLIGYVTYDMIHYAEHHTVFSKGSYLAGMKTYHMKHHYANMHHLGYGISSKLWDIIFQTELILPRGKDL